MVMNALDHLQSQGRKVVLISHVQEMHERIPVQIQVKPVGAGASTISGNSPGRAGRPHEFGVSCSAALKSYSRPLFFGQLATLCSAAM